MVVAGDVVDEVILVCDVVVVGKEIVADDVIILRFLLNFTFQLKKTR